VAAEHAPERHSPSGSLFNHSSTPARARLVKTSVAESRSSGVHDDPILVSADAFDAAPDQERRRAGRVERPVHAVAEIEHRVHAAAVQSPNTDSRPSGFRARPRSPRSAPDHSSRPTGPTRGPTRSSSPPRWLSRRRARPVPRSEAPSPDGERLPCARSVQDGRRRYTVRSNRSARFPLHHSRGRFPFLIRLLLAILLGTWPAR